MDLFLLSDTGAAIVATVGPRREYVVMKVAGK
jgi:hypothetical protein